MLKFGGLNFNLKYGQAVNLSKPKEPIDDTETIEDPDGPIEWLDGEPEKLDGATEQFDIEDDVNFKSKLLKDIMVEEAPSACEEGENSLNPVGPVEEVEGDETISWEFEN